MITSLSVRDLLESPALTEGTLIGGAAGLGREVVDVQLWDLETEVDFACRAGDAVLVVDPVKQRRRGGALESLMRRARSSGAVAPYTPQFSACRVTRALARYASSRTACEIGAALWAWYVDGAIVMPCLDSSAQTGSTPCRSLTEST